MKLIIDTSFLPANERFNESENSSMLNQNSYLQAFNNKQRKPMLNHSSSPQNPKGNITFGTTNKEEPRSSIKSDQAKA